MSRMRGVWGRVAVCFVAIVQVACDDDGGGERSPDTGDVAADPSADPDAADPETADADADAGPDGDAGDDGETGTLEDTGTVVGQVLAVLGEDRLPVAGARVWVDGGPAAEADGYGQFVLADVPSGLGVRVNAAGPAWDPADRLQGPVFGTTQVLVDVFDDAEATAFPRLLLGCAVYLDGSQAAVVDVESCGAGAPIAIDFPSDAFVNTVTDLPPALVRVEMAPVDPAQGATFMGLPQGPLESALSRYTLGGSSVRLFDAYTGDPVQLADGAAATLFLAVAELPEDADASDVVALRYDEAVGQWEELPGDVTLETDGDLRLAAFEVEHFTVVATGGDRTPIKPACLAFHPIRLENPPRACLDPADCGVFPTGNLPCVGGLCGCRNNADCADNERCVDQQCAPGCDSDTDCSYDRICDSGACVAHTCSAPASCRTNRCALEGASGLEYCGCVSRSMCQGSEQCVRGRCREMSGVRLEVFDYSTGRFLVGFDRLEECLAVPPNTSLVMDAYWTNELLIAQGAVGVYEWRQSRGHPWSSGRFFEDLAQACGSEPECAQFRDPEDNEVPVLRPQSLSCVTGRLEYSTGQATTPVSGEMVVAEVQENGSRRTVGTAFADETGHFCANGVAATSGAASAPQELRFGGWRAAASPGELVAELPEMTRGGVSCPAPADPGWALGGACQQAGLIRMACEPESASCIEARFDWTATEVPDVTPRRYRLELDPARSGGPIGWVEWDIYESAGQLLPPAYRSPSLRWNPSGSNVFSVEVPAGVYTVLLHVHDLRPGVWTVDHEWQTVTLEDMVRVPSALFQFGCVGASNDWCDRIEQCGDLTSCRLQEGGSGQSYCDAGCVPSFVEDPAYSEWPPFVAHLDTFRIDRTEVTQRAYQECVADGACTPITSCGPAQPDAPGPAWAPDTRPRHPAVCVTWPQARAFCDWRGAALPTSQQWEAAARGAIASVLRESPPAISESFAGGGRYPWGDDPRPDCTRANLDTGTPQLPPAWRPCVAETDCAEGDLCLRGSCSAAPDRVRCPGSSCPSGQACADDICTPSVCPGSNVDCTFECFDDEDCSARHQDTQDCLEAVEPGEPGACTECRQDSDCPSGDCQDLFCVCRDDADCEGRACYFGQCVCTQDSDCESGYHCADGECLGACSADEHCPRGYVCLDERCFDPDWVSCAGGTVPVGSHPAGAAPTGVLDMVGNVHEWVADPYRALEYRDLALDACRTLLEDIYPEQSGDWSWYLLCPHLMLFEGWLKESFGPTSAALRTVRGSSALTSEAQATLSRRFGLDPSSVAPDVGFRCAIGLSSCIADPATVPTDCDADSTPDECEIRWDPTLDCNTNGVPDNCDVTDINLDCDDDDVVDSCQALLPSEDCDENREPDVCQLARPAENCAQSDPAVVDVCEIAAGDAEDCNHNQRPDECEVNSSTDEDENGVLDVCEGGELTCADFLTGSLAADLCSCSLNAIEDLRECACAGDHDCQDDCSGTLCGATTVSPSAACLTCLQIADFPHPWEGCSTTYAACQADVCDNSCTAEVCDDGADNDRDGKLNCYDPECFGSSSGCTSEAGYCDDDEDNDLADGADCADSDCATFAACEVGPVKCDDTVDNDLDSRTDCFDDECFGVAGACESEAGHCHDTEDNDLADGTDCADPDCTADDWCVPCDDGDPNEPNDDIASAYDATFPGIPIIGARVCRADEDYFRVRGPRDPDINCEAHYSSLPSSARIEAFLLSEDGTVRDSSVGTSISLSDRPTDSGHTGDYFIRVRLASDATEASASYDLDPPSFVGTCFRELICNDTNDNDLDGDTDCADPECYACASPPCGPCTTECGPEPIDPALCAELCFDGADNDGDGAEDCDDNTGAAGDCPLDACFSEDACLCVPDGCSPGPNCCRDGVDGPDGDGFVDCGDTQCFGSPNGCSSEYVWNGSEYVSYCDDAYDNDVVPGQPSDGMNCADTDCLDDQASCPCADYLEDTAQEDNDTPETATPMAWDAPVTGTACAGDPDYFVAPGLADPTGCLVFLRARSPSGLRPSSMLWADVSLRDEADNVLAANDFDPADPDVVLATFDAGAAGYTGDYTIRVSDASLWVDYELTLSSFCYSEDAYEENDTPGTAATVAWDATIVGASAPNDPDYFAIEPGLADPTGCLVTLEVSSASRPGELGGDVSLQRATGQLLSPATFIQDGNTLTRRYNIHALGYTGGYRVHILTANFPPRWLDYAFSLSSFCFDEDTYEPNDTPAAARPIAFGQTIAGVLFPNDPDFFVAPAVSDPTGCTVTLDVHFAETPPNQAHNQVDLMYGDASFLFEVGTGQVDADGLTITEAAYEGDYFVAVYDTFFDTYDFTLTHDCD